jgi:copper chaperone CopZ
VSWRRRRRRPLNGPSLSLCKIWTVRAVGFVVKKSLEAVPGVAKVTVSYADRTAIVTYDDNKVGLSALTDATANAGYPSTPKG